MFIAKVMSYFEIVLFSCLSYEYTKAIVNQVERIGRYFDFCLCETHMVPQNGKLIKDYGRVGRDEKRMVIVDYVFPTDKRWLKNFIKV
jgi:TFIIF-interacting CTD phosphatase-like protein